VHQLDNKVLQDSACTSSVIEDTFMLMKIQVLRDITPPCGRYLQTSSTTFLRNVCSYLHSTRRNIPEDSKLQLKKNV